MRAEAVAGYSVVLLGATLLLTGCGGRSGSVRETRPVASSAPSGAVSTLTADEVDRPRVTRVEELFYRIPGVQVSRGNDGAYSVRIRGARSFMANDEPLYVVDGVRIRGASERNALGAVSPRDVVRIDVLKDAIAAASYGSQGANGVIVITTRRRIEPE